MSWMAIRRTDCRFRFVRRIKSNLIRHIRSFVVRRHARKQAPTHLLHLNSTKCFSGRLLSNISQLVHHIFRNLITQASNKLICAKIIFNGSLKHKSKFGHYIYRPSKNSIVLDTIRKIFTNKEIKQCSLVKLPLCIKEYVVGDLIGFGQSGSVYELWLATASKNATSSSEVSEFHSSKESSLALKAIHNFDFNQPVEHSLDENRCELLPLIDSNFLGTGVMMRCRLKISHPNIVKMHAAFFDDWKPFQRMEEEFPALLPTKDNYMCIPINPKTLYIVMRRYNMSLKDYLSSISIDYRIGRLLFSQILEAISFLYDCKISHRDLKFDNILLEFDSDDQCPHLVISDFGHALSTDTWQLHYVNDGISLGGNIAHLPPEVTKACPSPNTWIDYSKADIWAAGLIGYEIFDNVRMLDSFVMLSDTNQHFMPLFLNSPVGRIMQAMLYKDPSKRPKPHVAANVFCMTSFILGTEIINLLKNFTLKQNQLICHELSTLVESSSNLLISIGEHLQNQIDWLISIYAAEAIISKCIDPVEAELRNTFLKRYCVNDIWMAIDFFFERD